jgi:hypothetical protein
VSSRIRSRACWAAWREGQRARIHRGSFTSVYDLNSKIRAFITGWNDHPRPFTWTKTPEQILSKANRKKTSGAGH